MKLNLFTNILDARKNLLNAFVKLSLVSLQFCSLETNKMCIALHAWRQQRKRHSYFDLLVDSNNIRIKSNVHSKFFKLHVPQIQVLVLRKLSLQFKF